MNEGKCEHIVFSPSPRQMNIVMDGRLEADTVKLLGVTITNDYKFTKHTSSVVSRMTARFPYVTRLKKFMTKENLTKVANSVVMSIPRYAAEVYCSTDKIQRRIQRSQNTLMRIILDPPKRTSVATMLRRTGWLNVKLHTDLSKLMLLRSCVISNSSEAVSTQLRLGSINAEHRYGTRSRDWKIAWAPVLVKHARAFLPSTVKLYNRLNLCSQGLGEKKEFKSRAKSKLLTIFDNDNL